MAGPLATVQGPSKRSGGVRTFGGVPSGPMALMPVAVMEVGGTTSLVTAVTPKS